MMIWQEYFGSWACEYPECFQTSGYFLQGGRDARDAVRTWLSDPPADYLGFGLYEYDAVPDGAPRGRSFIRVQTEASAILFKMTFAGM